MHSVRMLAEDKKDFIVVKLDIKNAFNEVSRAAILETLESEPSLRHMVYLAASVLSPSSGLESKGIKWRETAEGTTQGDPLSSPLFCVAWHAHVRELDAVLDVVGGMARFGMDDD